MSNYDIIASVANEVFLGVDPDNSEDTILQQIETAKMEMATLLEQYNTLKSSKHKVFTEEHFRSVIKQFPFAKFSYDDNIIRMTLEDFSLNYLVGNKQDTARNNATLFVGNPHNTAGVTFHKGRLIDLVNNTTNFDYDFTEECEEVDNHIHFLHSKNPGVLEEETKAWMYVEELGSPYFISRGDLSHPHAQGTKNSFSSICYGNNRWSDSYSRAKSIADYIDVLRRAALWFESANLQDMYGSHSVPHIKDSVRENTFPQSVRGLVNECFEQIITSVYKQTIEYINNPGSIPFKDIIHKVKDLPLKRLAEQITFTHEGKTYLSTTLVPFINAFITLSTFENNNDLLGEEHNPSLTSYTFTRWIFNLNSMYAAWVLTNNHVLPYSKDCMISDMRYCISLHMQHNLEYLKMTPEMQKKILMAPLALKDLGNSVPDYFNFI